MKVKLKNIWKVLVDASKAWIDSDPFRQSAIISYYAIFSIPGLLIIVIWAVGAFFGTEAVQGRISSEIGSLMGRDAARGVEELVKSATLDESRLVMKIIGIGTLIFGSTTLFFQLQKSLNHIWDVEAAPENNFRKLIFDRVYSLGLILVIAFLLLITLILSAAISGFGNWIQSNFGDYFLYLVQVIDFLVSLAVVTSLFAIMYKVLPDVEIGWRSVWTGALVTAVLFVIGKMLLGLYFGYADPTSGFGAAGTIILVMLWVNYSCLILFFGAQFTQVFARKYFHRIEPSRHAKWRANYILHQQQVKETEEKQNREN